MAIYVTGHSNPDTDSVTAAIAYAELLKAGGEDAIPSMQGEMNPETVTVLDRFGFSPLEIMTDATDKTIALVDHSDLNQRVILWILLTSEPRRLGVQVAC